MIVGYQDKFHFEGKFRTGAFFSSYLRVNRVFCFSFHDMGVNMSQPKPLEIFAQFLKKFPVSAPNAAFPIPFSRFSPLPWSGSSPISRRPQVLHNGQNYTSNYSKSFSTRPSSSPPSMAKSPRTSMSVVLIGARRGRCWRTWRYRWRSLYENRWLLVQSELKCDWRFFHKFTYNL